MNILYHHRTQGKGAEGVHIREIAKALRSLGNTVDVISPPGIDVFDPVATVSSSRESVSGFSRFWKWISKHTPELFFEIMEIGYNAYAFRNLKKAATRNKVDALYERYHFFGFAGALFAKKSSIPIVLEVNEVSGLKRVRGQVLSGIASRIEEKVFGRADAIIVVSRHLKKCIHELGVSEDKIYVIPNAVDVEVFNPDKTDTAELRKKHGLTSMVTVGFVGIFVAWHNFELLFNSFRDIVASGRKDVRLLLLGDGPLRDDLKRMVQDSGIGDYVIFAGNVGHAEVPRYIQAMDICIIPHSNEFRSPIKLFEYMAMGKPVVAPRTEPIEDVTTDNVNVSIFELGQSDSFKQRLIHLIDDENERMRIGAEAKRTILQHHLWRKNAERVMRIYEEAK